MLDFLEFWQNTRLTTYNLKLLTPRFLPKIPDFCREFLIWQKSSLPAAVVISALTQ